MHATQELQTERGSAGAEARAPTARAMPPGVHPAAILRLQRSAGNAAVTRYLQRCGTERCNCGGHAEPEVDLRQAAAASAIVASALGRRAARAAGRGSQPVTGGQVQTRGPEQLPAGQIQTRDGVQRALLQPRSRDRAAPPRRRRPGADRAAADGGDPLQRRVVSPIGEDGIRELRDVLGISPEPAVIDEDFANAVVRWQAMHRLTQDGQLGPASARPLFREMGAEGVARGEVEAGPTYTPTGTIAAPVVGGNQQATFRMSARFRHDPADNVYASCCEVRQRIRWDAASAAALPGGIPHGGFAAGTAANTWLEDRDAANNRYGHRTGPNSDPQNFDQYIDTNGRRNQAFGHIFRGSDSPGGPDAIMAGSWRFRLSVIDVCNGNAEIGGQDFVRVNW